jgi:hypothetical protein
MSAEQYWRRAIRVFTLGGVLATAAAWIHDRFWPNDRFFGAAMVTFLGFAFYAFYCMLRAPRQTKKPTESKRGVLGCYLTVTAWGLLLLFGVPTIERLWGQDAKTDAYAVLMLALFCYIWINGELFMARNSRRSDTSTQSSAAHDG